jgi:hypothetical protein
MPSRQGDASSFGDRPLVVPVTTVGVISLVAVVGELHPLPTPDMAPVTDLLLDAQLTVG